MVGYFDGHEVLFVHTEASDPEIGQHLTKMIGSPAVVVPELADIPDDALLPSTSSPTVTRTAPRPGRWASGVVIHMLIARWPGGTR